MLTALYLHTEQSPTTVLGTFGSAQPKGATAQWVECQSIDTTASQAYLLMFEKALASKQVDKQVDRY